jgi:hypothetical protein
MGCIPSISIRPLLAAEARYVFRSCLFFLGAQEGYAVLLDEKPV